ncbi:hypothetical protein KEJ39_05045 [Candidatus Bathyarchaeota archaeon]|nr:hypothetical protein [Candidatus Bathyarchaeota archaeon]
MNFGDAFTVVQSIMTFLIVTDVFYERIVLNKLLPKVCANVSLLGISRKQSERDPYPKTPECCRLRTTNISADDQSGRDSWEEVKR